MAFGYLGVLLMFIACIRYILITDDTIGTSIMTFSVIFLGVYFQYVESKLLSTKKEKLVFRGIS